MLSRPQPGEIHPAYAGFVAALPEGDVLAFLEAQGAEMETLLRSLGDTGCGFRYAPGKWSIKDLLQHLTDVERIFGYRCLRVARGDSTPLAGFDDNAFAAAAGADALPLDTLLADFQAARAANLSLFRTLTAEAWEREGEANGRRVLARLIPFFALAHAAHHLDVVRERYLPGLK